MRVVFLASTLRVGGAERITGQVSVGLARHGIDSRWALLRDAGPEGEALRARGLPLETGLGPSRWAPHNVMRLAAYLKGVRPQALYLLDHQNAVVTGVLAARLAGVPRRFLAVHTTGLWGSDERSVRPSLPRGVRTVLPAITRVVAVADAQARYLREVERVPAARIIVIRNGIDVAAFAPGPERTARAEALRQELAPRTAGVAAAPGPILGVVAALRPEKGHALLLAALAPLWARLPGMCLLLVGEGPERGALEAAVQAAGLGGRVRFLGNRPDVADLLALFDVVALPSHPAVETLPLAVMEAMAAGKPVVATRVGSLAELVDDEVTGRLVPPNDAAALGAALEPLLADAALRERYGRAGRIRAAEFRIEETIARTAALLEGRL